MCTRRSAEPRTRRVRLGSAALILLAATWPGWSRPAHAAAPAPSSIEVSGATRIEYDDGSRQWVFEGPRVSAVRGDLRIDAPKIVYSEPAREVTLPAGGMVRTPTVEMSADRLAANLASRHLVGDGHVRGRFAAEGETSMTGSFAAGHMELDDRPDLRQLVATGGVVIERQDRRLRGDRVLYNQLTRQTMADGHAELTRGRDRLRAEHIFVDLGRHEATADEDVVLLQEDLEATGDHGAYSEDLQTVHLTGNVVLHHVRDTMKADQVTVLLDRHTAIAEGHVELVAYPEGGLSPADPAARGGPAAPSGADRR